MEQLSIVSFRGSLKRTKVIPQSEPNLEIYNQNVEELSLDERPQINESDIPESDDALSPSLRISPEKENHKNVKVFPSNSEKKVHALKHNDQKQAPEWAFEEEILPNFPTETNSLRILVVTWNLYGKKPKGGIEELLNIEKVKHHVISIGTEECLRSIPASTLYESKDHWVNLLGNYLNKEYVMVKSHSMNALHLTVFVHQSILNLVTGVESAEVRTGLYNVLGNKGGIGLTIKVAGVSFLFVNCHLASGQNEIKQRNKDFERIFTQLELPRARVTQEKKMNQRSSITDRFDYIFWSGDFNYRINHTRETTINFLKSNKLETLLEEDQMTREKNLNSMFEDFQEGEIKFPPTYKYKVGSQAFDHKKKRAPGWTDRILYRSRNQDLKIEQVVYQSLQGLTISDHRPVFSQFVATFETRNNNAIDGGYVRAKTSYCNVF